MKEIERKWLLASDHFFDDGFSWDNPSDYRDAEISSSRNIKSSNFFFKDQFEQINQFVLLSLYITSNSRIRCKFPDNDTSFLIFDISMYPHILTKYYYLLEDVDEYGKEQDWNLPGQQIITFEKTIKKGSGLIREEENEYVDLDPFSFFTLIKEEAFPYLHKIRTVYSPPKLLKHHFKGVKEIVLDWFPGLETNHLMQNEFSKIADVSICNYYKFNDRTVICNKAPVILEIEFEDEQSAINFNPINAFGPNIYQAIIHEITDDSSYNNYSIATWKQKDFINHFKIIEKFIDSKITIK